MNMRKTSYAEGILEAFTYLLENHEEVFVIGQGLWSPWYVGSSMKDLDIRFGRNRVMDTPVSEDATTAIAGGASLCGYRPIVVHPRVDFMVLASNSIVNQIAKWSHMLGGQAHPQVTIRAIVNRGGEQGAQHSQALHSWFSHVPGLRVVMPATPADARDLLIASVLCDDPVLYIDDRWCYEVAEELPPIAPMDLAEIGPAVLRHGESLTIVGAGYSTQLALAVCDLLAAEGISAEVIDMRVTNPMKTDVVVNSVRRTGRLAVIDGSWKNCGLAGEVIAAVCEELPIGVLRSAPQRFTLPEAPAPTSRALEEAYYPTPEGISAAIIESHFKGEDGA
jgi:pyruvate/2-oxoglutarate/acetoin dehydrogenase E1 component